MNTSEMSVLITNRVRSNDLICTKDDRRFENACAVEPSMNTTEHQHQNEMTEIGDNRKNRSLANV